MTLVSHGTGLGEEGVKVEEILESGESICDMISQAAVREP